MNNDHAIIVPMETYKFAFDRLAEPAVTARSGDTLIFFTEDANVSYITKESDVVTDFDKMYTACGGCNPISGPVYIEDAKKGDYLAVDILDVKPGEERGGGYSSIYPGFGALTYAGSIQDEYEARTKIVAIEGQEGVMKTVDGKTVRFDLNPFIGTIGVAPIEDRRTSQIHGKDYGGNMDCPDVRAGSTVVFRCNHDGALLSIGDIHGAQGDGEITGCALECRGEVKVRVRVLKSREEAEWVSWPQCNSEEFIGALICGEGMNLSDQIRIGYTELVHRMERYYGFDKYDAYTLLNFKGQVRVGQVFLNSNACVVKIDRKYLVKQ